MKDSTEQIEFGLNSNRSNQWSAQTVHLTKLKVFVDLFTLVTKVRLLQTEKEYKTVQRDSRFKFNSLRELNNLKVFQYGGHSIAPKTTSANAASASP